jgi:tripartite-type tricarboxylate transporter receptor subunit TctC
MTRKTLAALFAILLSTTALAQPFPSRLLRLVVPYPPGGVTDILGRALAQAMSDPLGQPIVVDNRPGAGAALGAELVAKSPADGYTILLGASSTHVLNPLLYKLAYDPVTDFAPVGVVAATPLVLVVGMQNPATNVAELIAWLKSRPGQANFGSYGTASASHLAGELFKSMAGVDMVHVPYKGAAPAQADLISGQISLMFSDMSAMQHVKSGRLRALAMTSAKRTGSFPDVPTVAEAAPPAAGLGGYEVTGWFALYLPAGTPKAVVDRLNAVLVAAVAGSELRGKLAALGLEPGSSSPEGLAALMRTEREKWQKVIADAKIKVE